MASSIGETAKLVASLELKDHFSPAAKKAQASLGKLESAAFRTGQKIGKGLQNAARNLRNVAIVAGAGIAFEVKQGLTSLAELESATTSVSGAIKQMGQTGQVSAGQVAQWANEIETSVQAAFDDKEITAAASTLIRFGKVAPTQLRPALEVMTDLATKTGSVDSAASLLAKTLADPKQAFAKLKRQGILLTKAERDQIAAFVDAGDAANAQKVILESLAKTTKGAAADSVGEYGDALNMLEDATEDAQRALAVGFLPVIKRVSSILTTELAKKSTIDAIRSFGTSLAEGLDSLISIGTKLPWGTIGSSLKLAGEGAKAVLNVFTSLPSWVQTAVLTGWGLNKLTGGVLGELVGELGKGLIKGVLGMNAGVVHINAGTVVAPGGPGVPGATPGGGGGVIATAAKAILPVAIASIAVGAAGALADAIDPTARQPGTTPLGQRDPRRFSKDGQVIQNSIKSLSGKVDETSTTQGEKTRSAFNMQAEKQKAAIAAAAQKNTADAERIKASATINTLNSTSQIVAGLGSVVTAVNGIDVTVSSTTINHTTAKQTFYGPTGGSRNTGKAAGGFGGQ